MIFAFFNLTRNFKKSTILNFHSIINNILSSYYSNPNFYYYLNILNYHQLYFILNLHPIKHFNFLKSLKSYGFLCILLH